MGEGSTKTVLTLAFRPSSHRHFFSVNLKESQAQVKISQAKNSKFIFVLILTFDQISRRVCSVSVEQTAAAAPAAALANH